MDVVDLITKIYKINRPAAVIIAGGYLLIAIGAVVMASNPEWGLDLKTVLLYLLGSSFAMMVLTRIPTMATRIFGCFILLLTAIWISLYFFQKVTNNSLTPPVAQDECILLLFSSSCATLHETTAVTESQLQTVPAETVVPAPTEDLEAGKKVSSVYVQFAGYPRSDVVEVAKALLAKGWGMQGADRGGERLPSAAGKFEVRFFSPADQSLATALAADLDEVEPSDRKSAVKEVPAEAVSTAVPRGHLELWISE